MCAGLARADVYSCPTPPRESGGSSVGGGEAQEAACGGSKVAIPAILSRLPDPVLAVRFLPFNVLAEARWPQLLMLELRRCAPDPGALLTFLVGRLVMCKARLPLL